MPSLTSEELDLLRALGEQLKRSRLSRDDTQSSTAARLGISMPTYRKLEKGDPVVQIGLWIRAIRLYGDPGGIDTLFPLSLFDEGQGRQRASRRQP